MGGTFQAQVGAQFAFVALYNDSAMGHILRVIRYYSGTGPNNPDVFAFFQAGTVGTLVKAGLTAFSDEGGMAGSIYSGTTATLQNFGYPVQAQINQGQHTQSLPFAYVKPTYSLVFQCDVVNEGLTVGFGWEDLTIDMLCECELK